MSKTILMLCSIFLSKEMFIKWNLDWHISGSPEGKKVSIFYLTLKFNFFFQLVFSLELQDMLALKFDCSCQMCTISCGIDEVCLLYYAFNSLSVKWFLITKLKKIMFLFFPFPNTIYVYSYSYLPPEVELSFQVMVFGMLCQNKRLWVVVVGCRQMLQVPKLLK